MTRHLPRPPFGSTRFAHGGNVKCIAGAKKRPIPGPPSDHADRKNKRRSHVTREGKLARAERRFGLGEGRRSLFAGYWALDSLSCHQVGLSAGASCTARPAGTHFSPVARKSKVEVALARVFEFGLREGT
jgi:hypothetical protein